MLNAKAIFVNLFKTLEVVEPTITAVILLYQCVAAFSAVFLFLFVLQVLFYSLFCSRIASVNVCSSCGPATLVHGCADAAVVAVLCAAVTCVASW
jgi:hypothetical protein